MDAILGDIVHLRPSLQIYHSHFQTGHSPTLGAFSIFLFKCEKEDNEQSFTSLHTSRTSVDLVLIGFTAY